jgi:hypothetical protein
MADVDVCNEALALIGSRVVISAMTDDTEEAKNCNLVYAGIRDWLLSINTWNFARKTAVLSLSDAATFPGPWAAGTSPPPPWLNSWLAPSDMLRAVYVIDGAAVNAGGTVYTGLPQRFAVVDGLVGGVDTTLLLTTVGNAALVYVARVTDTARWSASFYKAVVAHVAWMISPPLIKNWEATKYLESIALRNIDIALSTNDIEGSIMLDKTPEWIQARGIAYTMFRPQVDSKMDQQQQRGQRDPNDRRGR